MKYFFLFVILSFLKFYSRDLNFSRVKIITPNTAFADGFKELQRDLELHDVKMMTMSEYFKNVLINLGYLDEKQEEISEYRINGPLLKKIYSEETMSYMFTTFRNQVNKLYNSLQFNTYANTIKEKYNAILNRGETISSELNAKERNIKSIIKLLN